MGKFFKGFCMLAVCFSVSVSAAPSTPEPMSGKTALKFFADNEIKAGWNLGNTLDAHNAKVGTEGVWSWGTGAPPATQELFNGVKASGFDIVRIPVTWAGHIGGAPNYTIDAARLQRVDEVIGYAKNAGIKAVIINVHHDGFAGEAGTLGFVDLKGSVNDAGKKAQVQNQLDSVWTQIAKYFKNYGDFLIFETLNEVHTGNWGSVPAEDASETAKADYRKEQDILFDWNQAALNAIRATGGNNAERFVAFPALGSTEPSYVIHAHNRGKLLPNDRAANGTGKLIVSVHYYHPWRYTVANPENTGKDDSLVNTWSDRTHPASAMGSLKTTFINNGIAVYAGEWGGPNFVRVNKSAEIKATHIEYISTVASKISENGVVPIYWDDGGNFRMLSRTDGKPLAGFYTDVYTAMMNAIKDGPIITDPPKVSGDTVWGNWTWSTYNDAGNDGTSTITLTESPKTQAVTGNITAAYEHAYAGWQAYPDDAATTEALKTAIAISFKVTGDGKTYKVILPTSDITDHNNYAATFSTTSGVETTVTLRISDFSQAPDWGVQKPFNQSLVDRIQWQTNDGATVGAFSLTVKDFALIKSNSSISSRRTAASAIKPALVQRGKVISSTAPISLYTLGGKLVATSSSAKNPESPVTLNLSRVPNGMYIAKSGAATLRVQLLR